MNGNVRTCACNCGASLAGMRADAVYASEACKKRAQRAASRDKAGTHPLRGAREEQEASDLKSKLSQIIYQGIVDRLKQGPVHADDLEPLFNDQVRDTCRRLVGAQFGSLASRGYIVERERRKSKVPSRKGAKSGVFEFSKKGRETLVGNSSGQVGASSGAAAVPGESDAIGSKRSSRRARSVRENPGNSAASPEVTGPRSSAVEPRTSKPQRAGSNPAGGSLSLAGVGGGNASESLCPGPGASGHSSHSGERQAGVADSQESRGLNSTSPAPDSQGSSEASSSCSGEPAARLFDDAPPSAYDPWKDAA